MPAYLDILILAGVPAVAVWAYGGPQLVAMARAVYSWCRP